MLFLMKNPIVKSCLTLGRICLVPINSFIFAFPPFFYLCVCTYLCNKLLFKFYNFSFILLLFYYFFNVYIFDLYIFFFHLFMLPFVFFFFCVCIYVSLPPLHCFFVFCLPIGMYFPFFHLSLWFFIQTPTFILVAPDEEGPRSSETRFTKLIYLEHKEIFKF